MKEIHSFLTGIFSNTQAAPVKEEQKGMEVDEEKGADQKNVLEAQKLKDEGGLFFK
jgi:hypothetical protein